MSTSPKHSTADAETGNDDVRRRSCVTHNFLVDDGRALSVMRNEEEEISFGLL